MPRRKRPSRVFVHQTPEAPEPGHPHEPDAQSSGSRFVIEELPRKRSEPIRIDEPNERR